MEKVSPFFYAALYPKLQEAAKSCGYALAIHGSMMRDFDLVAIPWSEKVSDVQTLVKSMSDAIGWKPLKGDALGTYPQAGKPHGRLVYPIHLECGFYIDLSILPTKM